jgi:phage major head subunit gpT-like protein
MITPANFNVFITNVNTMIGETYSVTPTHYQQFASTIPVTSRFLELGWTGMLPKMRVWNGPRYAFEPAPQTFLVEVLPYEQTLTLDRFRLDDDMFGIYYKILPNMARQSKRWPDLETRDLLENAGAYTGTRQNGPDGQAFFSTSHPVDFYNAGISTGIGSTYVNDFTGGGQNVTYNKPVGTVTTLTGGAFNFTSFATVVEYMRYIPAEDGEAWGITPSHIMHAPQLQLEVELVLKSTFAAPPSFGGITGQVGSADNPVRRFGMEPICNELLKNPYTWYVMDNTKAFRPVIWGLRKAPVLVPRTQETDPMVFDSHQFTWGSWGRAVATWGFSQTMARSGP